MIIKLQLRSSHSTALALNPCGLPLPPNAVQSTGGLNLQSQVTDSEAEALNAKLPPAGSFNISVSHKIIISPAVVVVQSQVGSDSLWPHGLQLTGAPCPSPSPGVCPSSCPLSWWCHPTISNARIGLKMGKWRQKEPARQNPMHIWKLMLMS